MLVAKQAKFIRSGSVINLRMSMTVGVSFDCLLASGITLQISTWPKTHIRSTPIFLSKS